MGTTRPGKLALCYSHMLNLCYIYLQNWVFFGANVGKYSSTMKDMGLKMTICSGTLKLRMRFWKQRAAKKSWQFQQHDARDFLLPQSF